MSLFLEGCNQSNTATFQFQNRQADIYDVVLIKNKTFLHTGHRKCVPLSNLSSRREHPKKGTAGTCRQKLTNKEIDVLMVQAHPMWPEGLPKNHQKNWAFCEEQAKHFLRCTVLVFVRAFQTTNMQKNWSLWRELPRRTKRRMLETGSLPRRHPVRFVFCVTWSAVQEHFHHHLFGQWSHLGARSVISDKDNHLQWTRIKKYAFVPRIQTVTPNRLKCARLTINPLLSTARNNPVKWGNFCVRSYFFIASASDTDFQRKSQKGRGFVTGLYSASSLDFPLSSLFSLNVLKHVQVKTQPSLPWNILKQMNNGNRPAARGIFIFFVSSST